MPSQVANCIKLFADDTKLYCRVPEGSAGFQPDMGCSREMVGGVAPLFQRKQVQGHAYRPPQPRAPVLPERIAS